MVEGTQERTSYGNRFAHFTRSRNVVGSVAVNASALPCWFPSSSAEWTRLPGEVLEGETPASGRGGTPSSPSALPLRLLPLLCGMSIGKMWGMAGDSERGSDDNG